MNLRVSCCSDANPDSEQSQSRRSYEFRTFSGRRHHVRKPYRVFRHPSNGTTVVWGGRPHDLMWTHAHDISVKSPILWGVLWLRFFSSCGIGATATVIGSGSRNGCSPSGECKWKIFLAMAEATYPAALVPVTSMSLPETLPSLTSGLSQ